MLILLIFIEASLLDFLGKSVENFNSQKNAYE